MQTFLPYPEFDKSALCLDDKRLGKQRVEALQILKALKKGEFTCPDCGHKVTHFNPYKTGYHCYDCEAPLVRTPWYNHPAVLMWKGYEPALQLYAFIVCEAWKERGFKDTIRPQLFSFDYAYHDGWMVRPDYDTFKQLKLLPPWVGDPEFHRSHKSNLVRKKPEWYGKIWKNVPNDLPYVWPVRKKK